MRHLRFLVVGRREEGCDCPKVLLGQSSRPPIGFTHTRSSLRSVPCPCRSIDGKSVVDHDPSFIVVGALAPLILPFAVTASPGGYWSSAWPLQSPPPSLMRSRCRSRARCVRASMRMTAIVVVQRPPVLGRVCRPSTRRVLRSWTDPRTLLDLVPRAAARRRLLGLGIAACPSAIVDAHIDGDVLFAYVVLWPIFAMPLVIAAVLGALARSAITRSSKSSDSEGTAPTSSAPSALS